MVGYNIAIDSAPGLNWLLTPAFNGPWIFVWFIVCAGLIIIISKFLVRALEVIAARVNVSRAFLGGIVMSLVVSLPELVASVFGGIEGTPMYSLYNETGSNMMQIVLLSAIMLIFFSTSFIKQKKSGKTYKTFQDEVYRDCFYNMSQSNRYVLTVMVGIYFCFLLFILVPSIGINLYIPGIDISIVSIIPFIAWLAFGIWSLIKKENHGEVDPYLTELPEYKWKKPVLWLYFIALAIAMIIISYINSGIVEMFCPIYGIDEQTSATILLSFATSLPEIISLIFLCRTKNYYLGLSTITGGALVNASFVFYTDCIVPGATFREFHTTYLTDQSNVEFVDANRMQYWIIVVFLITIMMYLTSIKGFAKNKTCMTINLSSILLTYFVGFILVTTLVNP